MEENIKQFIVKVILDRNIRIVVCFRFEFDKYCKKTMGMLYQVIVKRIKYMMNKEVDVYMEKRFNLFQQVQSKLQEIKQFEQIQIQRIVVKDKMILYLKNSSRIIKPFLDHQFETETIETPATFYSQAWLRQDDSIKLKLLNQFIYKQVNQQLISQAITSYTFDLEYEQQKMYQIQAITTAKLNKFIKIVYNLNDKNNQIIVHENNIIPFQKASKFEKYLFCPAKKLINYQKQGKISLFGQYGNQHQIVDISHIYEQKPCFKLQIKNTNFLTEMLLVNKIRLLNRKIINSSVLSFSKINSPKDSIFSSSKEFYEQQTFQCYYQQIYHWNFRQIYQNIFGEAQFVTVFYKNQLFSASTKIQSFFKQSMNKQQDIPIIFVNLPNFCFQLQVFSSPQIKNISQKYENGSELLNKLISPNKTKQQIIQLTKIILSAQPQKISLSTSFAFSIANNFLSRKYLTKDIIYFQDFLVVVPCKKEQAIQIKVAKIFKKITLQDKKTYYVILPYTYFQLKQQQNNQKLQQLETYFDHQLMGKSKQIYLWVDDNPINNDPFIDKILQDTNTKSKNACFIQLMSTQSALIWFSLFYKLMIQVYGEKQIHLITDMTRVQFKNGKYIQNKEAGIDLISKIQQFQFNLQTIIYCGNVANANQKINAKLSPDKQRPKVFTKLDQIRKWCFSQKRQIKSPK